MDPVAWGALSALSWGTADFVARLTGRAIGPAHALFGMLLVGSLALSLWVALTRPPLVWATEGLPWLMTAALGILAGTLLLYVALARGPVSVAAPITSSYPAFAVIGTLALGIVPSGMQWLGDGATMVGIWIVARTIPGAGEDVRAARRGVRPTVAPGARRRAGVAVAILAARGAVAIYGELQTLWLSRLIGLGALGLALLTRGVRPQAAGPLVARPVPAGWPRRRRLPTLFIGTAGAGAALAVAASAPLPWWTVLLARLLLGEAISPVQWGGDRACRRRRDPARRLELTAPAGTPRGGRSSE